MKESIVEIILQFCFPKACGVCGKVQDSYLCKKCELLLSPKWHVHRLKPTEPFQKHMYLFLYKGKVRELLLSYKFYQKSYLYLTFSEIFIKNKKIYRNLQNYDIILAVPISKQRKRERGYNQSALIAKKIAKDAGVFYGKNVLLKIKHNAKQSSLHRKERKQNVKNAYEVALPEKIKDKKVLLIDDIYTTGNTVKECAKVLKQAGAQKVDVLTIAKD